MTKQSDNFNHNNQRARDALTRALKKLGDMRNKKPEKAA